MICSNFHEAGNLVQMTLSLNLKKGQGWWGWYVISWPGMVILLDGI
ncbi:MAG: hypothetical protein RLZZ172_2494 [Bacteroidota bacterium]|jgi:uncharacterized protein YcaQ